MALCGAGLLGALGACASDGAAIVTTTLALGDVPATVETLAASVFDLDAKRLVASATVAVPKTTFVLGVPAERLLEFRVVARTAESGPGGAGMPAYYAAIQQTIPLGSDQEVVDLTVHRAGVLTLVTRLGPGVRWEDPVPIKLETDTVGELAPRFRLAPGDPERPRAIETRVLREGRWRASVATEDPDVPILRGGARDGAGLYVARELESVAVVDLVASTSKPGPTTPTRLVVDLVDGHGAPLAEPSLVRTASDRATDVGLAISARDAAGNPVAVELSLTLEITAAPSGLVVRTPATGVERQLPVVLGELRLSGEGRFTVHAIGSLEDGRTIEGARSANALFAGDAPGPAASLAIDVASASRLRQGGVASVEVLDARGLLAADASGLVDLGASDPWIVLDAPASTIGPTDGGHVEASLRRPSNARGLRPVLRASFTPSSPGPVLTTSVSLPLIELEP